jgi:PAS domain S-box-containing protein
MEPLDDTGQVAEKYRALFESNLIGVVISDLDEKILDANDMFLNLLGYTKEDLAEGKISWSSITPEQFDDIDQKKVNELLHHGNIVPFEKEYAHKEGHTIPVLVGATLIGSEPPLSICFALDITKQKKLEKKKDEFIGTVSHELKTPLAILRLQTENLKSDIAQGASKDVLVPYIDEIHAQIDQLTRLINDMLNSARQGDDSNTVQRTLFDLKACVQKEVSQLQELNGREIVLSMCNEAVIVNANQDQILQVTRNFIKNAIQYSPSHTLIRVFVSIEEDVAQVCVQDFGIGMSEKNIAHIFERHYRETKAGGYAPDGAGIGLHVVREIVMQHQGEISVRSQEGAGSTFCYTLPLAAR